MSKNKLYKEGMPADRGLLLVGTADIDMYNSLLPDSKCLITYTGMYGDSKVKTDVSIPLNLLQAVATDFNVSRVKIYTNPKTYVIKFGDKVVHAPIIKNTREYRHINLELYSTELEFL